jgi:hypothetical protein
MLTRHVALVSEESSISMSELMEVAAALDKQATRDLGPAWGVQATVTACSRLEQVPLDYWPIIIKDDIGDPNALGYHTDRHRQPYSLVKFDEGWTVTCSHECIEMLVDPQGSRMVAGQSPVASQGKVRFLVEPCDPSEASTYKCNDIDVSDFYFPAYFEPEQPGAPQKQCSYTGALTRPRQVIQGGYLSWHVPSSDEWWQLTWFGGARATPHRLAALDLQDGRLSLREAIDRTTVEARKDMSRQSVMSAARSMVATDRNRDARASHLRAAMTAVGA